MASSSSAACCCFSSSQWTHRRVFTRRSTPLVATTSIRFLAPPSPTPIRAPPRLLFSAASSSSAPDHHPQPQDDASSGATTDQQQDDDLYGFRIQVSKPIGSKRNRRLVRASVRVHAPLEAVWDTLTDYEGLADFIPGLSECRLLQKEHRFARLYQVGEQDLALGFKFNAKGTVDCFEGEMELVPAEGGGALRRREIAFDMIDGDFKLFQGKWSLLQQQQLLQQKEEEETTLVCYSVELEPKLWVPVSLLESRICNDIKTNLVSISQQAQRIHHHRSSTLQSK